MYLKNVFAFVTVIVITVSCEEAKGKCNQGNIEDKAKCAIDELKKGSISAVRGEYIIQDFLEQYGRQDRTLMMAGVENSAEWSLVAGSLKHYDDRKLYRL